MEDLVSQAISRLKAVQMDRKTDTWTDGCDCFVNIQYFKNQQHENEDIICKKNHKMTHIKSKLKKKALFVLFSILQPAASTCRLYQTLQRWNCVI